MSVEGWVFSTGQRCRQVGSEPKSGEAAVELYNLHTDVTGTMNLGAKYPDKVNELVAEMTR
ncbi:MAG: hypothetical protein QHJ82_10140 [Verrucomicrobiota bacterium]|nr:hypothetical protein [Verrucomicrobiota bacterium]